MPLARALVPRQRMFAEDLVVINKCLDELIARAKETRSEGDEDALQARDYTKVPQTVTIGASFALES